MQATTYQRGMQRLAKLGARVGISPPEVGERLVEYAARIINAIDPDDEEQDGDIRFVVLAVMNERTS